MSNETKQDVFKDVVTTLHVMDGAPDDYCKELLERYSAALPDSTPVIPEAVSEYIQWGKSYDIQLHMMYAMMYASQLINRPVFTKITDDAKRWIISSSNIFATAWVLGSWRVEETGKIVKLEADK